MRSNGHKLSHTKFHFNTGKNLMLRMAEHWGRLPREVAESLSLEMFQIHLLQVTLPWHGWTG